MIINEKIASKIIKIMFTILGKDFLNYRNVVSNLKEIYFYTGKTY